MKPIAAFLIVALLIPAAAPNASAQLLHRPTRQLSQQPATSGKTAQRDSPFDGMALGAVVGFLALLLTGCDQSNGCGTQMLLKAAALGAGVGFTIDLLKSENRPMPRPPGQRAALTVVRWRF